MWAKPVCTNRKSASAQRCLRALGATRAMGIPVMRRSKHSRQGVFSHQGLRKASAANPANTGLASSAGMAAMEEIRAFVGHSFDQADAAVVDCFLKFFDQLANSHPRFSWEHAEDAEPRVVAEKVMSLIANKNVFIGICTKKEC